MPKRPPQSMGEDEQRVGRVLAEAVLVLLLIAAVVFGAWVRAGVLG